MVKVLLDVYGRPLCSTQTLFKLASAGAADRESRVMKGRTDWI